MDKIKTMFDTSQFIDMHNHILPGVDDGPDNIRKSIGLAEHYTSLGVRSIITTPHYIPGTAWTKTPDEIILAVRYLNKILLAKKISLTIYPGMEIAYHAKLDSEFRAKNLLSLGKSSTYLLEPSFHEKNQDILTYAEKLFRNGIKTIIAHPERIKVFQEDPGRLIELSKEGIEVQLNIGSILGKFGKDSRKTSEILINSDSVHYLASDAHNANKRRPPSKDEWRELVRYAGNDLLMRYCVVNPGKLIPQSDR